MPTVTFAIASGVGDSGHESIARAIRDEGVARGHRYEPWELWPADSPCARDVLFGMYREYAREGNSALPAIIGSSELRDAISADLAQTNSVPDVDVIIAVHPWSAHAVATLATAADFTGLVVWVHADFTPFPIVFHPRIDFYVGTWPRPPGSVPRDARLLSLGIPVRASFTARDAKPAHDRDGLVIADGATPFNDPETLLRRARAMQKAVPAAHVTLCIGHASLPVSARAPGDVQVIRGQRDLGAIMATARIVVTKPGVATVAEAIASGAIPAVTKSVVPWEAKARRYLLDHGVAAPYTDDAALRRLWDGESYANSIVAAGAALELETSAERLWRAIETSAHAPERPLQGELAPPPTGGPTLERHLALLRRTQPTEPLRSTARLLIRAFEKAL